MVARRDRSSMGWASPNGGLDDDTQAFYRRILESNRVRSAVRKEFELVLSQEAERQTSLAEAREVAARQARRMYRCEACGLEFLGILAYAEHDEETSHMTEMGKRVDVSGSL